MTPVCHCKWLFIPTYSCLIWSTSGICSGATCLSSIHLPPWCIFDVWVISILIYWFKHLSTSICPT